jgi:hypothetical protein
MLWNMHNNHTGVGFVTGIRRNVQAILPINFNMEVTRGHLYEGCPQNKVLNEFSQWKTFIGIE